MDREYAYTQALAALEQERSESPGAVGGFFFSQAKGGYVLVGAAEPGSMWCCCRWLCKGRQIAARHVQPAMAVAWSCCTLKLRAHACLPGHHYSGAQPDQRHLQPLQAIGRNTRGRRRVLGQDAPCYMRVAHPASGFSAQDVPYAEFMEAYIEVPPGAALQKK
jgi:hypothetical protein